MRIFLSARSDQSSAEGAKLTSRRAAVTSVTDPWQDHRSDCQSDRLHHTCFVCRSSPETSWIAPSACHKPRCRNEAKTDGDAQRVAGSLNVEGRPKPISASAPSAAGGCTATNRVLAVRCEARAAELGPDGAAEEELRPPASLAVRTAAGPERSIPARCSARLAKVKAGADRDPASRCPHRGREI